MVRLACLKDAHARVTCFLLTDTAPQRAHGYFQSGWPTFEMNIARVLKAHKVSQALWDGVIQVGERTRSNYRSKGPPMSVEAFAEGTGGSGGEPQLVFTNGKADAHMVSSMYAKVMRLALDKKETLYFAHAEWTDRDVMAFVPTLSLCPALRYLKLRHNHIDDAGIECLCGAIKAGSLSVLKILWLGENPFGVRGLAALADAGSTGLKPAERRKRAGSWLSRSMTRAEVDHASQNGRLQSLKWLDLDGCTFKDDDDALDTFFDGLLPGALRSLETLSLRGTRAGARIKAAASGTHMGHEGLDRAKRLGALPVLKPIRGGPIVKRLESQSVSDTSIEPSRSR